MITNKQIPKYEIPNTKYERRSAALRVGFDLDGVLLYNPARIARLPVAILKRILIRKKRLKFLIPTRPWEKMLWILAHKSSLFLAGGFDDIKKLVDQGKIEAYIVTARYSFLEKDFKHWLDKMKINHTFKATYQNIKDEQPHLFKERMIKELNLDVFVEDNYDIVHYLQNKSKAKIYWIYNILDRAIEYPHKFSSLKKIIERIGK